MLHKYNQETINQTQIPLRCVFPRVWTEKIYIYIFVCSLPLKLNRHLFLHFEIHSDVFMKNTNEMIEMSAFYGLVRFMIYISRVSAKTSSWNVHLEKHRSLPLLQGKKETLILKLFLDAFLYRFIYG